MSEVIWAPFLFGFFLRALGLILVGAGLSLVAEPVRLPAPPHLRFVQGHPQHVQVGGIVEGQPVPQSGVDLHGLGEQLRPPALGLPTHLRRDWNGQATQAERSRSLS